MKAYAIGSFLLLLAALGTGWIAADQHQLNQRLHREFGIPEYATADRNVIIFGWVAIVCFMILSLVCAHRALHYERKATNAR